MTKDRLILGALAPLILTVVFVYYALVYCKIIRIKRGRERVLENIHLGLIRYIKFVKSGEI